MADLPFLSVPLPPGDEPEPICSRCGGALAVVLFDGLALCPPCSLEHVGERPARRFVST